MNFSFMIKALAAIFLFFLSGCTSSLIDTMDVKCAPQPLVLEARSMPEPTLLQLKEIISAHGLTITEESIFHAFKVDIKNFKLNLKALYQDSTTHNLFRNIEGAMTVATFDLQTGDLLWEKEYHAAYTLKSDPHFYSQNQLALAQKQWELQRELFMQLSADLSKLCAIQASGYS